jgi:hypothetical protein
VQETREPSSRGRSTAKEDGEGTKNDTGGTKRQRISRSVLIRGGGSGFRALVLEGPLSQINVPESSMAFGRSLLKFLKKALLNSGTLIWSPWPDTADRKGDEELG